MADSATAAPRSRAPTDAVARSLPAWALLGGLVLASVAVRYAFGRRMVAPWIMVDEIVYSELAKSFAAGGHFLIRDEPAGSYGLVYPVLISPAYRLFAAVPDAYAAAKAINAVLMSLAAVPAWFLARRVLQPSLALLAALLTVAVPSTLYAGTLMTENAFYPLFLCAALALVLCLEQPTAARQLVLLAVAGVCFATRAQAVALVPALATAPLLLAWLDRARWRSLRRFAVLYGVLGGALVLVVAVQLARGRSPRAALGAYETAGHQHYDVGQVAKWLLYHVAELDLYLGVLPFAALLLVAALARSLPRRDRVFVAAAVPLVVWLVLEVAAFASLPTVQRIEERNMFYVAPLAFVALLLWVERGLPRPPRVAVPAAAVAAALPGLLPFPKLIGVQIQSDTLELLPWWWLQDHVVSLGQVRWVALGCAIVLGAVFLRLPARLALALPALVLVYYAVTLVPIENGRHGVRMASLGELFQGITTGDRDWVDARVGRDARVPFVWSGRADPATLWENEFFSRSVGRVYNVGPGLGGGLPATDATVDPRDGRLAAEGTPILARYVLTDESLAIAGRVVARDRPKGIVLLEPRGPLRRRELVSGVFADTWSGPSVTYTRFDCRGGSVAVDVQSDAHLLRRSQMVASGRARVRVPPGAERTLVAPLQRSGERCVARFRVSPTKVPGTADGRRLGLHFVRFAYRPPR